MASRPLTMHEINKAALDQFVYQSVNREMISFLAEAAQNVITCDSALMPPSSSKRQDLPPMSPEPQTVRAVDDTLPTLEEFITQLVVSSNLQVPTLMSTLVYLTRLKSKLQSMACRLRYTTHRIFLASLILTAKYLNDSSPKNKHWADYTHINTDMYSFGFNYTEVNLMEKELLFRLEWELRITDQDLYRELDSFLEPLRARIAERHACKMHQREEKRQQQEIYAAATRYPSPASSRGNSRSGNASPERMRAASGGSITPPGLTYSSSVSSYASSIASKRQQSRSNPPFESDPEPCAYETQQRSLYDSPVEIVIDADMPKVVPAPSGVECTDATRTRYRSSNMTSSIHTRELLRIELTAYSANCPWIESTSTFSGLMLSRPSRSLMTIRQYGTAW